MCIVNCGELIRLPMFANNAINTSNRIQVLWAMTYRLWMCGCMRLCDLKICQKIKPENQAWEVTLQNLLHIFCIITISNIDTPFAGCIPIWLWLCHRFSCHLKLRHCSAHLHHQAKYSGLVVSHREICIYEYIHIWFQIVHGVLSLEDNHQLRLLLMYGIYSFKHML